jgi:hypothetical protein
LEKRTSGTSGAKALIAVAFYGTAEAVPFVQSVFPQPVQSGRKELKEIWALASE